ncbi:Epimerase family protein [Mycobacteroides abscessus subsp. massiliense]|uniref:TIGR01777 family oxidoreductase n=1 Tax=Mycobacteroides abscessus TaxID=36809 RepID=UPI0009A7369D|nr:TIGR01777 family oxidoreductase [Mycobacteroides abscessus]SKR60667.1 Epimerase family protein [Mycobacteroides abscessus subsp. massiliense]SKR67089.1 Epimerase family protein [Mycobacteroides abscessus subsp. massiliense]SKT62521.1 Epimerase family protein [Mycobacteroides abscessus subsp. massiliense]SKT81497.1 Epimerase family protein [Mycobacteroides abscessus subsp. massiliense]SLA09416.1 Epimerase family protein [Mycobacteroides abscessus subsp. massiliense]
MGAESQHKRIVIAGSSGVIGSALVASLRSANHTVVRLVRRDPMGPDERRWDPASGQIEPGALDGADAVVNMCGVGVGDKRWSGAYKQEIYDSRVIPTEVLARAIAEAEVPVLINASAVGYYGDSGDRIIDETASSGSGFLARVCLDWEAATAEAAQAGTRVVIVRTGLVLSPAGGLFGRSRPLFSLGLGARLGNGRWYMPWISLEDHIRALEFALTEPALSGPVNLTGPAPVTNAEFTAALGRVLHRPTLLVAPQFALSVIFGEFADAELTSSMRVIPAVLEQHGFEFEHHTIGEALAYANNSRPMK